MPFLGFRPFFCDVKGTCILFLSVLVYMAHLYGCIRLFSLALPYGLFPFVVWIASRVMSEEVALWLFLGRVVGHPPVRMHQILVNFL